MAHPYFARGALTIGMVPGLLGLNALLRPNAVLEETKFPASAEPAARKTPLGLLQIYGIRNVSVSYLLYLLWSTGDEKLFGMGMLAGVAMTFTDGLVFKAVTGGGEWNHWPIGIVIGGLSAGLLGFFN